MDPYFSYLNAPFGHSQWVNPLGAGSLQQSLQNVYQQAAQMAGPKVTTMYVIRGGYKDQYARVNQSSGGFTHDIPLDQATRFSTASYAADAITRRQREFAPLLGRGAYVIVPVTVTESPARLVAKQVEEKVPAKTVYIARNADSQYAKDPAPDGSTGYAGSSSEAKQWLTAESAAAWLVARLKGEYFVYSTPFTIVPREIPATTSSKTVEEKVPASTTVVLA